MSDSREPSYYEIALTSRQAFTAFVLLLVCVVTSFFAGVLVGRSAGAGEPFPVAESATAGSDEGSSQLEELKFFGEREDDGGSDEVAASSSEQPAAEAQDKAAEPTLLDQLAGEGGTSRPAARSGTAPRQAARRRPRDRPAAGDAEKPDTGPTPSPAKEPLRDTTKPAPAAATATDTPSAAQPLPSADEVIIQVFSSADRNQASRVYERLRADGYSAYVEPIQEGGKALFRVRIGPFPSKEAAEPAAAAIRRKHRLDTWITRAGG